MPNLPWVMLRAPRRGVVAPPTADVAPLADGVGSHDQPTRTAKERLGAKASDEQRAWSKAAPAPAI